MIDLTCPVCGELDNVSWRVSADLSNPKNCEQFEYRRCNRCLVAFLSSPPMDLAPYYLKTYYAYQSPSPVSLSRAGRYYARRLGYGVPVPTDTASFRNVLAQIRSLVEARKYEASYHLPPARPGGKLLDSGCGSGRYLDLARLLGWETYGVEMSPEASAIATAAGHVVFQGDVADARFAPGMFDYVQFWHSLEHVRNPLAILRLARSWLSADGSLTIAVPNADSFGSRLFRNNWFNLDPPRHIFAFGPSSIAFLLRSTGFRISSMRTYSLPSDWIKSLKNGVSPSYRALAKLLTRQPLPAGVAMVCRLFDRLGYGEHIFVTARPV